MCRAFGSVETLQVEDVPEAAPGPGQVLVDVRAAALNRPDVLMVEGTYQVRPPLPFSPGVELAGVVARVGDGVTEFRPGDRVMAFSGVGAFAAQCVCGSRRCTNLPEEIDFLSGGSLLVAYGTALHGLSTVGRLEPGETALVLGAGGAVGVAAVEVARALGARVIAAASTESRRALALRAGADEALDYTQPGWRHELEALTNGQGVDVVFDAVGGPFSEVTFRAMAWHGRFLVVGFASGEIARLKLNLALLQERRVLGVFFTAALQHEPQLFDAYARQLVRWFVAGKLRPLIAHQISLEGVADAMRRLSNREVMGRIVVVPDVR